MRAVSKRHSSSASQRGSTVRGRLLRCHRLSLYGAGDTAERQANGNLARHLPPQQAEDVQALTFKFFRVKQKRKIRYFSIKGKRKKALPVLQEEDSGLCPSGQFGDEAAVGLDGPRDVGAAMQVIKNLALSVVHWLILTYT